MSHQNRKEYIPHEGVVISQKFPEIVREFFNFSKLDLCDLVMQRDKRFSRQGVENSVARFQEDVDVFVEVFRCALCIALNLDTSVQYAHYRVLSETASRYLIGKVTFCKSWSVSRRQGVLEYCMQAVLLTKESVLKEENNGQHRNL